jgi:crossover junction endodeoxyribonuclease RusA
MIAYTLILPLSPSINSYYKASGNRRYISEAGQRFRKDVAKLVKEAGVQKMTGRLWLTVRVHPRDRRLQDIDNRIKSLQDALEVAGAYDNDEQIDDLRVLRGPIVSGGRMEVMIGVIDAP